MNIVCIGFAAWAAALLMGAAATAQAEHETPAQGPAEFAADAPAELEVKRARTGHLLVQPVINGRPAGWFIFDTGAGICVISTPVSGNFDLKPSGVELSASGVGGQSMTSALLASTLRLGPVTLHDVPLMQTDLSFLREYLGEDIAGVVG
jgi:predicted aspartyl protease